MILIALLEKSKNTILEVNSDAQQLSFQPSSILEGGISRLSSSLVPEGRGLAFPLALGAALGTLGPQSYPRLGRQAFDKCYLAR